MTLHPLSRTFSRSTAALASAAVAVSMAAGIAGVVAGAGSAQANPTTFSRSAAGAAATSAVTWNGWRGVRFDDTVASAHQRLGGKFYRVATDGGCGDVLTTRTGSMNGNVYSRPHRVGTIIVASGVDYPAGVNAGMRGSAIEKAVRKAGYTVTSKRVAVSSDGDYDTWDTATGPKGRTLWWATGDGTDHRPYRMGLSINRHVAVQQLGINGC